MVAICLVMFNADKSVGDVCDGACLRLLSMGVFYSNDASVRLCVCLLVRLVVMLQGRLIYGT